MDQEKILEAIANLQINLQGDIVTLKQNITKKKNLELETKMQNYETVQSKQDSRLNFLEREYKKRNILVHGIKENIRRRLD